MKSTYCWLSTYSPFKRGKYSRQIRKCFAAISVYVLLASCWQRRQCAFGAGKNEDDICARLQLSVQAAGLEGEVVRAHEGLVQGKNQMESLNSRPEKGFSKLLNFYSSLFCRKFAEGLHPYNANKVTSTNIKVHIA